MAANLLSSHNNDLRDWRDDIQQIQGMGVILNAIRSSADISQTVHNPEYVGRAHGKGVLR